MEFEFRGYTIETDLEKKALIRGSIVNNLCLQFGTALHKRDYEKCIKLGRKLENFTNKYKGKHLYLNLNYKDWFIYKVTLFESYYKCDLLEYYTSSSLYDKFDFGCFSIKIPNHLF